jgi:hypothetical protein
LALVFHSLSTPSPFAREFKIAAAVSLFNGRYWGHSTILARLTEWDWFKRGSDGMRLFKYWSEKGSGKRVSS